MTVFSGYILLSCLEKTQINRTMLNNYVIRMYDVTDSQKQKKQMILYYPGTYNKGRESRHIQKLSNSM